MSGNTAWFRDSKWGVFVHFLNGAASAKSIDDASTDAWNRRVDAFDVAGLCDQLQSVGAGYLFLTIGQNSGFYCSPNATYDDLVGERPSRLSRRDLIGELADALAEVDIPMMAYLPSHAPALHRTAIERLACTPEWDASQWGFKSGEYDVVDGTDERLSLFQRNWEAVVREWSMRWGEKVHGWWFDGCYYADTMYRHADEPGFRSFAAACRAGNPNSIVAFNPGIHLPVISLTEHEDFTAGELADSLTLGTWTPGKWPMNPVVGEVDGVQLHVLTFLGDWWGAGSPRFPDELAVGYTKYINSHGGVISWDAPVDERGHVPEPFLRQLGKLPR